MTDVASVTTSVFSGLDRPLGQRMVRMTPAVLLSLALHGGALLLAGRVAMMRHSFVTMLDPAATNEKEDKTEEDQQEQEPEVPELTPGIEDGAKEARVTWIGYREYEEHLAALAEVDQAAFASSEAGGLPVEQSLPENEQQQEVSEQDVAEEGDMARMQEQQDVEVVVVDPADQAAEEMQASEEADADSGEEVEPFDQRVEHEQEQVLPQPAAPTLDLQSMLVISPMAEMESVDVGPESEPEESAQAEQQQEAATEDELTEAAAAVAAATAEASGAGGGAKQGDPTVDADAEKSEKDTSATSVHDVPESVWRSGKPMAMEGLEIQPYSLYRHVLVDSNDRMLTLRWAGSVKQNAVVSLQFDSKGVVQQVKVFRATGYESFDRLYLRSWLARWTAKGEDLKKLGQGELCEPIVFKLQFIPEKEKEKEKDGGKETAKGNG